jgi:hypothetical protein
MNIRSGNIRTFVTDGSDLGIEGQILITVYGDRATIATRESGQRTWSPPIIVKETT